MTELDEKSPRRRKILAGCLLLAVGFVYYFSNPKPQNYYDYTFRVADNMLRGAIAFTEKQPSWLNEFVPFEGFYYSVFPLGSVLTMIPFAFFKLAGVVSEMPAAFIAALSASAAGLFLLLIARHYKYGDGKRLLMVLAILFGTWMWTNLTMGGAWQLALGFAMVGELGAIYFTVYKRKPLLAGFFFAMGFGNRTEILLTAPIFMFLLIRSRQPSAVSRQPEENAGADFEVKAKKKSKTKERKPKTENLITIGKPQILALAGFCAVPFVLGVSTLLYNYARFHSFTDFGYARIPGVLDEPWYNHGIFSIWYIPGQAYEMLFKLWERKAAFPYLVPNGFSASILWSSPFVLLALRGGARDKILKYASWIAIFVLTFLLWMHGNSGGWQFGYRYAMVILPWLFIVLLENSSEEITPVEWITYIISFILNAYATYLFFWTDYVKP
ncbi:MAG TPA: hypothetical protein VF604_03525 [Pyrinomonadaceae bacterium]|jgi:hypothetical protein